MPSRGTANLPAVHGIAPARSSRSMPLAFVAGGAVGILGGAIGLGGAEFRLPLLISLFEFAALAAVILNEAMSLVVVLAALPARLSAVSASELASHWTIAANLLAGSLLGAWAGASQMQGSATDNSGALRSSSRSLPRPAKP
ncbi:TSUP family transporter [Streptomyces sp. NPDC056390]|uniref:TSUP family transporter n=1 Tax=Streptomyces sp. NPDC056390 TaxID=3345806 RepID=UPI0035E2E255